MPFIRFQDVVDQLDYVDDHDVLERARSNPALMSALEMSRPRNWRGSGLRPEQILPIATRGGIPVAWVPSTRVLQALVAARPTERLRVLLANEGDVVKQCRVVLIECDDPWVDEQRHLVARSLAAYESGFHEAAMALAVAVGEGLACWASTPRVQMFEYERTRWEERRKTKRYLLAKRELDAVDPGQKLRDLQILRHALIGPIPQFFTPYHGKPGEPIPETVSRHATVHKPTIEHLSRENALLALMLCVSILREQQDWAEEVRMNEETVYNGA